MKALLFFCSFVPFMLVPASLHSQQLCALRTDFVEKLKEAYNEEVFAVGKQNDGLIVEVFSSPSGTFTVFTTGVDGLACLIAAGTDFEMMNLYGHRI